MKLKLTAKILSLALLSISLNSFAQRGGDKVGGGGDAKTEGRIKEIRNNILEWINADLAKGLDFKGTDIDYETYLNGNASKNILGMKSVLQPDLGNVIVTVIKKNEEDMSDYELNTWVDGQPKTCKRFISKKDLKKHILCNFERFWDQSESEQYKLVHHEYAGLAGVELTDGADSDYVLSNQITAQLRYESVLKLPVKKPSSTGLITNPSLGDGILIATKSSHNGVCKALGYERAAVGSVVRGEKARGPMVIVQEDGSVGGGVIAHGGALSANEIRQIICLNKFSDQKEFTHKLIKPLHLEAQVPFSENSNQTGVCKSLQYDRAAVGTKLIGEEYRGPMLIVQHDGSVLGGSVAGGGALATRDIYTLVCVSKI